MKYGMMVALLLLPNVIFAMGSGSRPKQKSSSWLAAFYHYIMGTRASQGTPQASITQTPQSLLPLSNAHAGTVPSDQHANFLKERYSPNAKSAADAKKQ